MTQDQAHGLRRAIQYAEDYADEAELDQDSDTDMLWDIIKTLAAAASSVLVDRSEAVTPGSPLSAITYDGTPRN